MKKYLSFVLAIILVLPTCFISAAEDNTWTADMESKYYILNQLGIVIESGPAVYYTLTEVFEQDPPMVSDEHLWFKNMSKSSFINYLCNIIGGYGFDDTANEQAIDIAESYGLIHKNQDDLYKSLTYEEALTMLVRLLGYGEHAEMGGGFPNGYIAIASRLGLCDGISAKGAEVLKTHEAITLLYNAINCAYVEIAYITNEGIVYGNTSDKTLLHEFRKIYRIEGVVEATGTAALSDSSAVGEGQVRIGGYIYNTDVDLTDMLGLEAEVYVKENSRSDDTVIFAFPRKDSKQIIISDVKIADVSEDFRRISYYDENDKKKEAVISPVAKIIYNGQPLAAYTEDKFKPQDGSIRLIENDGNSGYDVVHIQSFKTIVVDSISPANMTVGNAYSYDENNLTISFEATGDDIIRIYDPEGKETEMSSIVPGDILRVAESSGNSRRTVTAYISREKTDGVIEKIQNGDRTKITIGGIEYIVSEAYKKAIEEGDSRAPKLKAGEAHTFYLDNVGRVAFASISSSGANYGIVMATAKTGIPGMSETCKIKLFDAGKGWLELECDDKVVFDDGNKVEPADKIGELATVANGGELPVISYELNGDGKIKSIDLPEASDGEGNGGRFNTSGSDFQRYRPNNTSFESKYFIDKGAKVILVDSNDVNDESSYLAGTSANLTIDAPYTMYAYSIDEFNFADLFVVMVDGGVIDQQMLNSDFFVVENVGQAMNSAGEVVTQVTGMMGNYLSVSYTFANEAIAKGIERGDIISFHVNIGGDIDVVKKYRSGSAKEVYEKATNPNAKPSVIQGKVKKADIANERVKIAVNAAETEMQSVRVVNTANVFIYEQETQKLIKGSVNDIEAGDMIAVRSWTSKATAFVIYR